MSPAAELGTATTAVAARVPVIFLDAVGTLIYPSPAVETVYAAAGQKYSRSLQPHEISTRFHTALRAQAVLDERAGQRTSEQREKARWKTIVAAIFESDCEVLFDELWRYFASPSSWRTYPEVAEVLRILSDRGQQLFITSNFDARLHGIARGLTALNSIERVFVSSEVGWKKAAREFYPAVCQTLDLEPADVLVVGDHPFEDVELPRNLGMATLLLARNETVSHGRISSLRALL